MKHFAGLLAKGRVLRPNGDENQRPGRWFLAAGRLRACTEARARYSRWMPFRGRSSTQEKLRRRVFWIRAHVEGAPGTKATFSLIALSNRAMALTLDGRSARGTCPLGAGVADAGRAVTGQGGLHGGTLAAVDLLDLLQMGIQRVVGQGSGAAPAG